MDYGLTYWHWTATRFILRSERLVAHHSLAHGKPAITRRPMTIAIEFDCPFEIAADGVGDSAGGIAPPPLHVRRGSRSL